MLKPIVIVLFFSSWVVAGDQFAIERVAGDGPSSTSNVFFTDYGTDSDGVSDSADAFSQALVYGNGPTYGYQLSVHQGHSIVTPAPNETAVLPQLTSNSQCMNMLDASATTPTHWDSEVAVTGNAKSIGHYKVLPLPNENPGDNTLTCLIQVTNNDPEFRTANIIDAYVYITAPGGSWVKISRHQQNGVDGWKLQYNLSQASASNPNAPRLIRVNNHEFIPGDYFPARYFVVQAVIPEFANGNAFDLSTFGIADNRTTMRMWLDQPANKKENNRIFAFNAIMSFAVEDN